MRAVNIHVLGLALTFLIPCQQKAQSLAQDTGTLIGQVQGYNSNIKLPIKLCSIQRVLQTESGRDGAFTLTNVPAGRYDLLVGNPSWSIFEVREIQIEGGSRVTVTVDRNSHVATDSTCFRDAIKQCVPTDFTIHYRPPTTRKAALISGQVVYTYARGRKGLARASIRVFKTGTDPLYTIVSDKRGRFQLTAQAGIYSLIVSHKGFLDVKIPDFLVPLENETDMEIETSRTGSIVVCQ